MVAFLPPASEGWGKVIFTARVHSTREGNIYTWECLSVDHCRGGVPHPRSGGYPISGLVAGGTPSQVWLEGVPQPRSGLGGCPIPGLAREVPHPRSGRGIPHPRSGQGVPHPRSGWGEPHPRSGWGGYPIPGLAEGGTPFQVWGYLGYHLPRPGMGYPLPRPEMGYPSLPRPEVGFAPI